jgi:hypothetical protein
MKDTEAGSAAFLHRKHNFILLQATVTIWESLMAVLSCTPLLLYGHKDSLQSAPILKISASKKKKYLNKKSTSKKEIHL